MANWYIGTMGFSYQDWSEVFYPPDMDTRDYLSYYSRIFNAVEIDSTFYGIPKAEYVQRWAATTPDDFKFCVKVPRLITHDMVLSGTQGLVAEFVNMMRLLEEKLGVILIQFPPSFKADQSALLDDFLGELPGGVKYAVEVRHRSWYTAEAKTEEILRQHGVAWAATQYPGLPRLIHQTARFVYTRWIGRHGSFERHSVERLDRSGELKAWLELFRRVENQVEAIYGFTNNDYAGFAPGTANRFKEIAGLPVEPLRPAQQGKLF